MIGHPSLLISHQTLVYSQIFPKSAAQLGGSHTLVKDTEKDCLLCRLTLVPQQSPGPGIPRMANVWVSLTLGPSQVDITVPKTERTMPSGHFRKIFSPPAVPRNMFVSCPLLISQSSLLNVLVSWARRDSFIYLLNAGLGLSASSVISCVIPKGTVCCGCF